MSASIWRRGRSKTSDPRSSRDPSLLHRHPPAAALAVVVDLDPAEDGCRRRPGKPHRGRGRGDLVLVLRPIRRAPASPGLAPPSRSSVGARHPPFPPLGFREPRMLARCVAISCGRSWLATCSSSCPVAVGHCSRHTRNRDSTKVLNLLFFLI
jgi:hypothetical protein